MTVEEIEQLINDSYEEYIEMIETYEEYKQLCEHSFFQKEPKILIEEPL